MTFRIYHHFHIQSENEGEILKQLSIIIKNQEKMSQELEDIKAALADVNDATNNIAADLERLASEISGGITKVEAAAVAASLRQAADKLKEVAAVNPE